jgi:hypothetical protein
MKPQMNLAKLFARPVPVAVPKHRQERELMALAREHRWNFGVLGAAPIPIQPVFYKDWWIVPIVEDRSQIPARTLERVQTIYQAGIRPKAFVILHEAPKQLLPPKDAPRISPIEFWAKEAARHSLTVLKVTGTVLTRVVLPVFVTVLGGLSSAILTDPVLIAVTEDNVWIAIDAWMA